MVSQDSRLTDQDLLLAADGELQPDRTAEVTLHLSQCWHCRARKQEMEPAIVDFIRLHRGHLDPLLPPVAGPRDLLKARLAEMASVSQPPGNRWLQDWRQVAAALLFAAILAAGYHFRHPAPVSRRISSPEPSLTPGAVAMVNRGQVCNSAPTKNRAVPMSVQLKVFEEYGIRELNPEPTRSIT
jgi:hypothetical protein